MIRAELCGRQIIITADDDSAPIVAALPDVSRTARMPPHTWALPFTWESIQALRCVGARASRELVDEANRLGATRHYIEAQKQGCPDAVPLRPMPLKRGVKPYNHQIRAYNIVLALYGYEPAAGGDVQ